MECYKTIRANLYGGHWQNPFSQLLEDRAGIRGPVQGTPEEFSQILYELTQGELNRKSAKVTCEAVANGKKNILKFMDGCLFNVIKTKGGLAQALIVITPYAPSRVDLFDSHEIPLAHLVFEGLRINEAYTQVASEYRREERKLEAEKAAEERRLSRESSLDRTLTTIEKAKSGETIMIRGMHNIEALAGLGFVRSLVDNPDNWIDAEDFPGMRYRHAKSGIEMLLTGREKFRPIEELNRLELFFFVNRSDDDPASFVKMQNKFRETNRDGSLYSAKEFHDDLIAMAKYPEELKGRTEADLGLMADEVGVVIDRRQELDKGILPYDAVFNRDTQRIIDYILKNKTPAAEIRKALDYFEYTGMIDSPYKETLDQRIKAALAAGAGGNTSIESLLYDKRVKEIVATVLKKLAGEQLTLKIVTVALAPYVNELGFGKLVKIRERILQLKELVRTQ